MDFLYNNETRSYQIKDFELVLEDCKKFIEANGLQNLTIINEEDYRACKKARTLLNNKLKEIRDTRLQVNKIILGELNKQSKEIEDLLDTASKNLTAKINDFTKPTEVEAETKHEYSFSLKVSSKEQLTKFIDLAKKLGTDYVTEL